MPRCSRALYNQFQLRELPAPSPTTCAAHIMTQATAIPRPLLCGQEGQWIADTPSPTSVPS